MNDNQCTFCLQLGHRASNCPNRELKVQTTAAAEHLKAVLKQDARTHIGWMARPAWERTLTSR